LNLYQPFYIRGDFAVGSRQYWTFGVLIMFMCTIDSVGCSSTPKKQDQNNAKSSQQPIQETKSTATLGGPSTPGANETMKEFDLNRDNKPDVWAFFKSQPDPANEGQSRDVLVKKEWDFNFDSKIDIRRHYNDVGEVIKDNLDLDFDGRFDVTTNYQGGVKTSQEYDFNFDTKPDYWKFFEKNVIARTERDRDFNGRVDRWEYYADGKIDRIGLDEDGDGQIDKWIQEKKED
jgi:hypothetical protein